jgi:DNA-binding FadR family transcriptional regulator
MMTLWDGRVSRSLNKAAAEKLGAFRRLAAPPRLTAELVARLTADIVDGRLAPGSRLPTEQEMIAATGVSRTVVREAVAHLRAEGLVITRQGVGAFVTDNPRRPFRIDLDEARTLREVLDVMELRTGVEVEAAGLAAERATPAQIAKIATRLDALEAAIRRDESAVSEDFALHCAIAEATGNPQFTRFLEYLGRFVIPRNTIAGGPSPSARRGYAETFQKEHRQIVDAIRGRSPKQASAAMRRHLMNSRKRYSKLASLHGKT